MPNFKQSAGFKLGFSPYTRGDSSPFKSTPAQRIAMAKKNAKFDYRNAISGTDDPTLKRQAKEDYNRRMAKIKEREKDLTPPNYKKHPGYKASAGMRKASAFKSVYTPGLSGKNRNVKWELEANMRRKKKDDEKYAAYKAKKKKK